MTRTNVSIVAQNPTREVFYLTSEGPGLMISRKQGSVRWSIWNLRARGEIQDPCGAAIPLYGIEDGERSSGSPMATTSTGITTTIPDNVKNLPTTRPTWAFHGDRHCTQ
ncbi:MAG: hypothetical protein IPK76_16655 [Lewinellaceae bacterium]|nr:hypothetical protein [Lewinellaceae bacterium]